MLHRSRSLLLASTRSRFLTPLYVALFPRSLQHIPLPRLLFEDGSPTLGLSLLMASINKVLSMPNTFAYFWSVRIVKGLPRTQLRKRLSPLARLVRLLIFFFFLRLFKVLDFIGCQVRDGKRRTRSPTSAHNADFVLGMQYDENETESRDPSYTPALDASSSCCQGRQRSAQDIRSYGNYLQTPVGRRCTTIKENLHRSGLAAQESLCRFLFLFLRHILTNSSRFYSVSGDRAPGPLRESSTLLNRFSVPLTSSLVHPIGQPGVQAPFQKIYPPSSATVQDCSGADPTNDATPAEHPESLEERAEHTFVPFCNRPVQDLCNDPAPSVRLPDPISSTDLARIDYPRVCTEYLNDLFVCFDLIKISAPHSLLPVRRTCRAL